MRKHAGQERQTLRGALAAGLEGGAFELPECCLVGVVPSPARPLFFHVCCFPIGGSRDGALELAGQITR